MTDLFASLAAVATRELTAGRVRSLAALAVALFAAILGIVAVNTLAGPKRRARGIVAAVAGGIAISESVLHLATATGAIGTGSGVLGAIVALGIAGIGTVLGALAIARAGRTA